MSSVSLVSGSTSCSSGPVAALAHALCLLLERRLEVDHETPLVKHGAILRQQNGAAAGGEHDGTLARDVLDDFALALAKAVLAFAGKDVRDIDAGARLDLRIAVAKRRAQQPREMFADGGLARAHRADQEDVCLARWTSPTEHSGNEAAARRRPRSMPGYGSYQ